MRRVTLVVFLVVTVLVPAGAGTAQEGDAGVLLIMDASGSMKQEVSGGVTLLDEAKAALREIVLRLPGDTEVGLRVYGHRAPNDDKAAGCVDTELIIPVGPIDRGEMLAAIGDFDASGFTPIGLSLQEAVADLGTGGGTIILVSDGIDTCAPPDPCEVAQQLAEDGYVSHIHTVGLFLQDQAAVDQLQCIADAGNGTFTDVASVDGILDALVGVIDEAVAGGIGPAAIQGALERNLAPVVPWRGDEHFDLALAQGTLSTGEVRWYAVEVTRSPVQLAATLNIDWQPDAEPDEYLEVRIFDENGVEIGVPHEIAGVVVEAPQRLVLVEAADWLGEWGATESWPTAMATTDPVSMFPSWEADQPWFAATVERFHDAGLTGGIYEIFKRQQPAEALEPGTYYVAVVWDAEREATTAIQLSITSYPFEPVLEPERMERPWAPVRIDDGSVVPFPLDPQRWSGGGIGGGFPEPTRAIEVWSAVDGESQRYGLDLVAGEVLAVGWDLWKPYASQSGEVWLGFTLVGPTGEMSQVDFDTEGPRLGFADVSYFVVPEDGPHTIVVETTGDPGSDLGLALAALVLPPHAYDVLEAHGIAGWDPGIMPSDEPRRGDQARGALIAGLRAVAEHVEGG